MAKNDKVRVLVGTRKGSYVVESDRARKKWAVSPVSHEGSDVYHIVADPRKPGELFAAVNSWFWGPTVHRSKNWGKKWEECTTPLTPLQKDRKGEMNEDDILAPVKRPLNNLWHIEPGSAEEEDTVWLGADPHLLFRSDDRGGSWTPIKAINEHPGRAKWSPGAGGACLHTILLDPTTKGRMYIGLSAVGTFRSEDGGVSWQPTNKNVECPFFPEGQRFPETGQCVHHVAIDAADPNTFYRQDHGGMYVSHDRMDSWKRIGKSLGDDFGFCVASPKGAPGKAYFVRLDGMARVTGEGHFQVHEWNDRTRKWRKLLSPKAFPGHFGVQREGIATDDLPSPGIYVGTTTGQLFWSANGGKSWGLMPFGFPAIHSVSVASPGA